ncbi:natural cytotoxicity triggering receptor 3 ligand 1-like [Hoplias malabaricus]|uniref:natural cytotoxicity triggering receptor 3 ligand 1-like n=1 Tax=Hoplias malabaricus TaxID=27720 RepID=UPI003462EEEB
MTERFDVDEAWLLRGNASMIIRNVTLGDEGEYSCGVIIQPDQYDHTVHLKLSAQPSVSLPGLISVAPGEEKMLRCDITKFYPEQLRVMWWNETGAEPVRDVCTGVPVPNADGTFNVTSRFTVKTETLGSEVTVYKCLVEHRSFSDIYSKNVTIRVQAPVSVSEIIKPDVIYASTLTKLSCRIIGVGPKQLKVQWFKLSSHNSENSEEPERNREADSLTGDWSLQNNTEMESENKVHTSILSLKLTINDDQTKYCCVVHCRKEKIIRSTTLSIKVEPELLQISSQPQIPRLGHSLVLCCRIEKFYPENIHLEWHKQGEELQQSSVQFGPFSDHHNLYSMWSKTELTVMPRMWRLSNVILHSLI